MLGSFSPRSRRTASLYSYGAENATLNVQEPAVYHGKMCAATEDATTVDVIFGVSVESIQAVTIHQHKIVYQCLIAAMKEVVWDHSEKSVQFVSDDSSQSPSFIFPVLTELEAHMLAIFAGLEKPPEQAYIGVLIGQNLPSPIQQRRASAGFNQPPTLPMTKRRELLQREQPVRNTVSRERLGIEYIRTGYLSFTCSINGDLRGLTLGVHQILVFPSPDCHDRSACLFSYGYEYLDSCEVGGTRLELRFRMTPQLAKQPGYFAFQSLEAQYIREAIWYFKHGTYMDTSLREMLASPTCTSPPDIQSPKRISDCAAPRRMSAPMYFKDTASLKQRIDACCHAIGCPHLGKYNDESCGKPIEASGSSVMANSRDLSHSNPGFTIMAANGLCDYHAAYLSTTPNTSLSRRLALSRDRLPLPVKSLQSLIGLVQSSHYAKMFKFQGQLLKRQDTRKFHLGKTWHPKYAVLFETPVGGFLCYYDRITHCPGMTDTPKERRMIDLSSVVCIRPVSIASPATRGNGGTNTSSMHAFDVVTLYRTWTFAAIEPKEYEVWLNVLTDAVEKHASIAPDKPLSFPVKLAMTGQSTPSEATSLEISQFGVSFCTGHDAEVVLSTWYYTDLEKWSVVLQQGYTCCLLRCRSPAPISSPPFADGGDTIIQDYLFRTTEASAICLAIEFYVGKCMAKLEVLTGIYLEERRAQTAKETIAPKPSSLQRNSVAPKIGLSTGKELPIGNVALAPVRSVEGTMAFPVVTRDPTTVETLVKEPHHPQEQAPFSQEFASGISPTIPLLIVNPMSQNANVLPIRLGSPSLDVEPAVEVGIALLDIDVQVGTDENRALPTKEAVASAAVEAPVNLPLESSVPVTSLLTDTKSMNSSIITSETTENKVLAVYTSISLAQPLAVGVIDLAAADLAKTKGESSKYGESGQGKNQLFEIADVPDLPDNDTPSSVLPVDTAPVQNLDEELNQLHLRATASENYGCGQKQEEKVCLIEGVVDAHEAVHGTSTIICEDKGSYCKQQDGVKSSDNATTERSDTVLNAEKVDNELNYQQESRLVDVATAGGAVRDAASAPTLNFFTAESRDEFLSRSCIRLDTTHPSNVEFENCDIGQLETSTSILVVIPSSAIALLETPLSALPLMPNQNANVSPLPNANSAGESLEQPNSQDEMGESYESECEVSDRSEAFNSCASYDDFEDAIDSDVFIDSNDDLSSALALELRISSVGDRIAADIPLGDS